MTEYSDMIENKRKLLLAEEWAKGVQHIHVHRLKSMWYDTRPEDTADGKYVRDTQYNDESIERELEDGTIVYLGVRLSGDALIKKYLSEQ